MDFVVEEDLKAHLTCWYIQKYVKENPQPQYLEHISQWANMALRRREECVAAHVRVAVQLKELPGIVDRNLKWLQGWLIPRRRPLKAECLVKQLSHVSKRLRSCDLIHWDLTKAAAFHLRQKTSKMRLRHWLEVTAVKRADVSQVSCFSLDAAVAKQQ